MSAEFDKMPVQEQAELLAQQSANEAYLAFEEMMPEFQAAMAKAEQEAKPKVHYLMFREVFLPWFAGDENRKYPTVNITHWLSISGNVFQAVDIVDDAGNVIMRFLRILTETYYVLLTPWDYIVMRLVKSIVCYMFGT